MQNFRFALKFFAENTKSVSRRYAVWKRRRRRGRKIIGGGGVRRRRASLSIRDWREQPIILWWTADAVNIPYCEICSLELIFSKFWKFSGASPPERIRPSHLHYIMIDEQLMLIISFIVRFVLWSSCFQNFENFRGLHPQREFDLVTYTTSWLMNRWCW